MKDINSDGRSMAEAWLKWIDSAEGVACSSGSSSGEFLKNRLWHAFMAGCKARLEQASVEVQAGRVE